MYKTVINKQYGVMQSCHVPYLPYTLTSYCEGLHWSLSLSLTVNVIYYIILVIEINNAITAYMHHRASPKHSSASYTFCDQKGFQNLPNIVFNIQN